MATSGLDPYLPTLGDIVDDAMEMAGIDPASASQRHLSSAVRSMNDVYLWLQNKGEAMFRDDVETAIVAPGQPTFYAPKGTLSIKQANIRIPSHARNSNTPLTIYAKSTWFDLTDKSQRGRPSILAVNYSEPASQSAGVLNDVDRLFPQAPDETGYGSGPFGEGSYGGSTMADEGKAYTPGRGPQAILWPVPDQEYQVSYIRVRESQRARMLCENIDARSIWTLAIKFKLASFLALKFNVKLFSLLEGQAQQHYQETLGNNRETSDTRITMFSHSPLRGRQRRW
jgi:hypothetical protein